MKVTQDNPHLILFGLRGAECNIDKLLNSLFPDLAYLKKD